MKDPILRYLNYSMVNKLKRLTHQRFILGFTHDNIIIYGALAGIAASVVFLIIHHITISPIWFIFPFASLFGAITGICLVWFYQEYFSNFSIFNTLMLLLIYTIPVFILEIVTFIFLEKSYTLEEAMDPNSTGPLLMLTFGIVIPFSVVYGLIQGWVLGGSKDIILSSVTTNLVIFTGIGHNLPIFNAIETENSWLIWRTKILTWFLLLILMATFAITLHLLMKLEKGEYISS